MNDLQTDFSVKFQNHVFTVRYRVVLLVSDMPATASMLNMHHHLATYGCTLCLVETKRQERIRYYPFKRFKMRTAEIHNDCLRILERQRLKSFKGVKGNSQLFDLIPNLPLAAPVDAMHQVYLSVTKVMMQVIVDKTRRTDIASINSLIQGLKVRTIKNIEN